MWGAIKRMSQKLFHLLLQIADSTLKNQKFFVGEQFHTSPRTLAHYG
ncbi:MAG: hypothetical protein RIS75_533 [Actinomycetota bacterium]